MNFTLQAFEGVVSKYGTGLTKPFSYGRRHCDLAMLPHLLGSQHELTSSAQLDSGACVQTFVLVSAGETIADLHSMRDLYTWRSVTVLSLIVLLLLGSTLARCQAGRWVAALVRRGSRSLELPMLRKPSQRSAST